MPVKRAYPGLKLVQREPGGPWHIHGTHRGRRYRVSTKTTDLRIAQQKLLDLSHDLESPWRGAHAPGEERWSLLARRLTDRHRHSARVRNIPFDLTALDVLAMLRETGFRCSVSGIALTDEINPFPGRRMHYNPWGASIDRIDWRAGYVRDNVRITCIAANLAMNAFGYDTLLRLAKGVVRCASAVVAEVPDHPSKAPARHDQIDDRKIYSVAET